MVSAGTRTFIMAASLGVLSYVFKEFFTSPQLAPVIQIATGSIQGRIDKARDGTPYYSYLGIPYAQAPMGDLRFESPLPPSSWEGVRDASKMGSECMQLEIMTSGRILGSEDCLFLNVFAPKWDEKVSDKKLLPVMVYVHGGYYMMGSSNMYKGKYFMSKSDTNVILVTMNYRVAALGFLNTGDGVIKGNMGLKDQAMALKWVQQNIHKFGGDKNRVTLFGESAGAGSVHSHILSPVSKGLFHRAICQSGSALSPWSFQKDPAGQAKWLAEKLKCPAKSSTKELVDCLKRIKPEEFVKAHMGFMSILRHPYESFVPTLELPGPDAFFTEKPIDIIKKGTFNKVPLISGVNSHEGLMSVGRILSSEKHTNDLDKMWNEWAPLLFNYDPANKDASRKIREFYFGKNRINPKEDIETLTRIFSDRSFFIPSFKSAIGHAASNTSVNYYFFTYPVQVSLFRLFKGVSLTDSILPMELQVATDVVKDIFSSYVLRTPEKPLGPCHADELPLLFNLHILVEIYEGSRDYEMSKRFVNMWTSFAHDKLDRLKTRDVEWEEINPRDSKVRFLQMDLQGHMIDEPFANSVEFWESLKL